jgi:hypothetical protein
MFEGKLGSLGGLLAAAVLGASLPAHAQPLRNLTPFGEHGAANPPVARYLASQGRSFILDRLAIAPEALLKFDDNFEVWVLDPSPGPGGVTIYNNDSGDRVVRVTRLGGVTLYTRREPEGVPVSLQGEAEELLLPPVISDKIMQLKSIQGAYRVASAVQTAVGKMPAGKEHVITFEPLNYTPQTSAVFFDAMTVAADALASLAGRKEAKAFLSKLDKVQFIVGAKPNVGLNGSVLMITLTPGKGYAGRPSSNRIVKTALKK